MTLLPAARRAACSSSGFLSRSSSASVRSQLSVRTIRPLIAARYETTANTPSSSGAHAVSNPTLANIEKRWEQMPPQDQAELWMALRDRMTVDWKEMTMLEKRASYYIAFGPHGPRRQVDPKEKFEVMKIVAYALAASAIIFAISRHFAGGPPRTMTKEYQELSNEYLKAQKSEAITGISSPGYVGPGMVQSKPSGIKPGEEEEE